MGTEGYALKPDWERQWTVNLDAGRAQHKSGLTVEILRDQTNQWYAHAKNVSSWSFEDPDRKSLLPALLAQAEAVFLTALYAKEGVPKAPYNANFLPDGWDAHWTVDTTLHTARHNLTNLVFQFDSRRPDGTWTASAPQLAQWLAQNARRSTMFPVLQVQAHKIFNATLYCPMTETPPPMTQYRPSLEAAC